MMRPKGISSVSWMNYIYPLSSTCVPSMLLIKNKKQSDRTV